MLDILAALEPHLMEIASILIATVVAYVARLLRSWTGAEMDARAREALHSALLTGLRAAYRRGLPAGDAERHAALYAATQGSPDAVRRFGLTQDQLADMATAKGPD